MSSVETTPEKGGPPCLEGGVSTEARLRLAQTYLCYHSAIFFKPAAAPNSRFRRHTVAAQPG
jgi:hypothetical protein